MMTKSMRGWLRSCPESSPTCWPRGASDPRILIEQDRIRVAVRYRDSRFDTVVSCNVHIELTEQPNMLAVRLSDLRAGALPLPLTRFTNGISNEAAAGDIDVRWDVTDDGQWLW